MGEQRKHYNEEFKRQTVKFIQEQTKTMPEIAEDMNIPVGTLQNWMAKYRDFENEPLGNPERVRQLEQQLQEKEIENEQRVRENAELREELDILKKAVHIFSKKRG
ncbi:Transposase [compost metagenome]